ncbi:putative serine-threonine protein kinase [Aspergillus lucknowensis]|uniref:Serine-threonine protein kinase n=1 Tax=Aspergillus lucknowensis TaxID=176173 RepID=A0ABR4LYI7_9EURO
MLTKENPVSSFLAAGTVSAVKIFGNDHVFKVRPTPSNNFARKAFDIEVRAYERLCGHPRIATLREITDDGIVLEWGECLRQNLQTLEPGEIEMHTRLRLAREAAEGLCHIHPMRIIHADSHKIYRFAGSGIDGEPPWVCYEWFAYRPGSSPNVETDIFAFGSTLFEIESGHVPYHELAEELFSAKEYPNVENLILGDIITRCWDGDYCSINEVGKHLSQIEQ